MPIVPAGSPIWSRTVSFANYGGHPEKQNYGGLGVVNPRTDISAEQFCRLTADLEAIARTSPFAVITYQCLDDTLAAPRVTQVLMHTTVLYQPYESDAPPAGMPSAVRNGNGDVSFTFASSYTDAYGVTAPFTLSEHIQAQVHSADGCMVTRVSGTVVRVEVRDFAGVQVANPKVTLKVWA